jgi:hypothetical protein
MTNETRERIRAYKKLLPDMRERVLGVALLLITSVAMMVTASFAWITLSRAPEVTGMQTTVAANGNLEIALANGLVKDPLQKPNESAAGDSSAAEGQTIVGANITWGNLINVSDPTYGLSNLALRPALLNGYNRTDYPLTGATYGEDGRVISTNERYGFASYALMDGSTTQYEFSANDAKVRYGVRAISSMTYSNAAGNLRIDNFRNTTTQLYMEAQSYYGKIVSDQPNELNVLNPASDKTCISVLEDIVAVFADDKISEILDGTPVQSSCNDYLADLLQMMLLLEEALIKEGKAMLEMANWQAYIASGDAKEEKTFASIEALIGTSDKAIAFKTTLEEKAKTDNSYKNWLQKNSEAITHMMETLKSYKTSRANLTKCINGLEPMVQNVLKGTVPKDEEQGDNTYKFRHISQYVNILVDINTTTMNGVALGNASAGNATQLLGGGPVIVKKGELLEIEKRLVDQENRIHANVSVKLKSSNTLVQIATLGRPITGQVYTSAYSDPKYAQPTYTKDMAYTDSMESGATGDAVAKDTYGMALDVWVRTNYPGAILTLEGSVKYEDKRATQTIDGVEYELFTITLGDAENQTKEDVYQKDGKWYYVSTLSEVKSEDLNGQTPEEKYIPVIVGYEGENRIWEDWRELLEGGFIVQDATTQGAGSCFVFYASTPTEQAKTMELLESFRVAFMDQDGELLATAKLNLDSAYANQGKVTVPLEMVTGVEYTDEAGNTHMGIMRLTQNTPQFITSVVYLNGTELKNANVLAEGEIQGQLNIQFGTDSVLIAPEDEDLMDDSRSITAEVTVNGTTLSNGVIGGDAGLEYKDGGYEATVKLTVVGEQPERISGFFVRVINSTQGTRGESKDFVKQEDGTWVATFRLTNPGLYAFNTLIVDGVQYTLHDGSEKSGMNTYYPENRPFVRIQGLKIDSVTVTPGPGVYMTADASYKLDVTVEIEAAVTPDQVNAQFFSLDDKKQFTAILTRGTDGKTWTGYANISSSDSYILKYISVDGEVQDAPATGIYTMYLGLRASVETSVLEKDRTYDFIGGTTQFRMTVKIYDNSGKAIENLEGVTLYYNNILSPAPMTWNGSAYTGVLEATKPGNMTFKQLHLGDKGDIYSVSNPPAFKANSRKTPKYVSGAAKTDEATIIGSGLYTTMDVILQNGESASVWAEMERNMHDGSHATTVLVKGERTGENQNTITFTITEDGDWTLKRLLLQNVYDENATSEDENGQPVAGKWYDETAPELVSEENSMVLYPNDDDQLTTDVVATYTAKVYYDGVEQTKTEKILYGNTDSTPFMTEHSSKVLAVEVKDYRNRPIKGMTSIIWTITHNANTMLEMGGYTGNGDGIRDITMSLESGSQAKYVAPVQKFTVAGSYASKITVDLGLGEDKKITLTTVPSFEVRSKTPTVKITETSPNGTVKAYISHSTGCSGAEVKTESFNAGKNDEGTIANVCYTHSTSTADYVVNLTQPTVTITMEGYGKANRATLSFGADAHVYETNAGTSKTGFAWTGDGTCKRFIGLYKGGTGDDSRTAAGTIKATELVMYDGKGNEYKIPVNITINNPN